MKDLTLIIPAKQESESLPIFLNEIKNLDVKKKVILDQNDNDTIKSIKNFKEVDILFQEKSGYGAALIEGIKKTDTKYFCIINADGSMEPKDVNRMYDQIINKKLNFIFASRYEKPEGGSDDDDIVTLIGNYFFTKIGNIFFSLKLTDILFTFVMGETTKFNILNIKSLDFTFCIEFPIKAKRNGMLYETMPSYERSRIGGKKKVSPIVDGSLILIKMLKMFLFK
jgi:glycosyltransferase involved in cell wall biosynthesis